MCVSPQRTPAGSGEEGADSTGERGHPGPLPRGSGQATAFRGTAGATPSAPTPPSLVASGLLLGACDALGLQVALRATARLSRAHAPLVAPARRRLSPASCAPHLTSVFSARRRGILTLAEICSSSPSPREKCCIFLTLYSNASSFVRRWESPERCSGQTVPVHPDASLPRLPCLGHTCGGCELIGVRWGL